MTARHRVLPLLTRFALGAFAGFVLALALGIAFEGFLSLVDIDVKQFEAGKPVKLILLLSLPSLSFVSGIFFAFPEYERQRRSFWIATNRCAACGHSLRGIRDQSRQCPECGKRFKAG
jgi:hypothetical protein